VLGVGVGGAGALADELPFTLGGLEEEDVTGGVDGAAAGLVSGSPFEEVDGSALAVFGQDSAGGDAAGEIDEAGCEFFG